MKSKAEEELIQEGMQLMENDNKDHAEEKHTPFLSLPPTTSTTAISLPADLRMDEYSSNDEDDDIDESGMREATIGNLLIGNANEEQYIRKTENDDDDNLQDAPDTREYTPLSVDGLPAMGLTQGNMLPNEMLDEEVDDASDAEDVRLSPNDAILVVAKTEEDFATLEVHVYEQDTGNLFVHHDISLPSFPLALAHGDVLHSGSGNFCAVGTFSPGIEIWNLDVLNPLEPSSVLLGTKGHTDAVMALSWNMIHRQVLASGSADTTVKLWDVTQPQHCSSTLTHHTGKVQSTAWHTTEGTLLATGSYDKTAAFVDARSGQAKTIRLPADVESMAWDPFHTHQLTVATEDGSIQCWDVRKFETKTPVWSMVANEFGCVSDLSYNSHVPGMMVTCATDKTVTLWDTHNTAIANETTTQSLTPPSACGTKDMGVGKLYTVSFYPSTPWLLGCGGAGNEVALWDLSRHEGIQGRFGNRIIVNGESSSSKTATTSVETDFEAIMSNTNINGKDESSSSTNKKKSGKKKKKGGNKQKKAHRKGR